MTSDTLLLDPATLLREGRLAEAIAASNRTVRQAPTDSGARLLLAELLVFDGNLSRADAVLEAAGAADPGMALVVAEFWQLLRAARIRQQVLSEARVPEFLGEPTISQKHLLRALLARRAGDGAQVAEAAEAAEAARPARAGTKRDGTTVVPFDDFRDADDLWGGTIEVLTSTGKYLWIPVERLVSLQFHAVKRARDIAWPRCTMVVSDGPDGDVYVPALYDMPVDTNDLLRLGRGTQWSDTSPPHGIGQRIFLAGEDGQPIHQLGEVEFR